MFEMLANFLEPYLDLFPRFYRRPASNEFCVLDDIIGEPREIRRPVFTAPVLSHVEFYPATPFPIDLENQTLGPYGQEITINAAIMVEIQDPVAMRDLIGDEWVSCISQAARASIARSDLAPESMQVAVEQAVVNLTANSVIVTDFCLEDRAKTRSMRHYGLNFQS